MSWYTAVTLNKIGVTEFCESLVYNLIKKIEI